ncbi:MAG TPA: pyridoxamine 5'-phosphate oxidase family protein [Micromonosporaceae bacterium]
MNLDAVARDILDANMYMVIATADETGGPWASPVYFAADGYHRFYWVSSPDVQHSRNLAARPDVYLVVFDSTVPIGAGQAVYMSGTAEQLAGAELDRGLELYSRTAVRHGGRAFTAADVREPAPYRLYRATVTRHWVLDRDNPPDHRMPVTP